MIRLRRVTGALPAGFETLRVEAMAEGFGMLDTLAREWASGAQRFDQPGEMLVAAYVGDELAAIGGLTREAAIPGALRVRRFYVRPSHRRAGVARAIAETLLDGRAGTIVTCNAATGSESFWESLGFVPERRDGRTHRLTR